VGGKKTQVINEHSDEIIDLGRRVHALEAHITDLEERLNARGVFSSGPRWNGDGLCTVPGNPAHVWEDSRAGNAGD